MEMTCFSEMIQDLERLKNEAERKALPRFLYFDPTFAGAKAHRTAYLSPEMRAEWSRETESSGV